MLCFPDLQNRSFLNRINLEKQYLVFKACFSGQIENSAALEALSSKGEYEKHALRAQISLVWSIRTGGMEDKGCI